jgi:hypothetical protein
MRLIRKNAALMRTSVMRDNHDFLKSTKNPYSGCTTTGNSLDLSIQKTETSTFNTVTSDLLTINKKYGAANVLIVLDIDNTLLTSSVDIGGDICKIKVSYL